MADRVKARKTLRKHPEESLRMGVDFAHLLETGETLSGTPTPTVSQSKAGLVTGSADLTITEIAINGTKVQCRVAGGTDGEDYCLTAECATSTGNTRVGQGDLEVRDEC